MAITHYLIHLLEQLTRDEAYQLLNYAIKTDQVDMFRRALDSGKIYTEYPKLGALTELIKNGSTEVVKYFLDRYKTIDVTFPDEAGYFPIHYAAYNGLTDLVKLFLDKGTYVDVVDNSDNTPLLASSSLGYTNVAKLLLDHGADVNAITETGVTALQKASSNGHTDTVKLLLDHGADVNNRDENGWTPLAVADNKEVKDLLLQHGAIR